MEPQAALVGADGGTELDAVAAVDMYMALIIHPGHPEGNHALRLHKGFDDTVLLVLGVLVNDQIQAFQHFQNRLMEFPLVGIPGNYLGVDPLQIFAF